MSELSEQLFKDMFFFCDQYVEQNTGNFKQKRSELIFKKLKEELTGDNVATLPVDYAPTSFQTIVNRILIPRILVSIESLTNFNDFPYDNSETVIVGVHNSDEQGEQAYLADLNRGSKGFITKSNLYIIKQLTNDEEILKHLGGVKNKHPNLEVMVYFIGESQDLSDLDKTFLSAFLDMFPEKSFVVATYEDSVLTEQSIGEINDRNTTFNLNGKLLGSLTEESAKNNAVYNVPSKNNRSERVIKEKIKTKLESLALIQQELSNIYIQGQGQGNTIQLKSDDSGTSPVVKFDVTKENKDKLINIISEDLFGDDTSNKPLYFFDGDGNKYDKEMCESDDLTDQKQSFICSCVIINQEIDKYIQKIKDLEKGIEDGDKKFKQEATMEAELAAKSTATSTATSTADRATVNRPAVRPTAVRPAAPPAAPPAEDRPTANQPTSVDVGKKLTFVGVKPDDNDLKRKEPKINYIRENGRSKINIKFNFTEEDKISTTAYLLYKNTNRDYPLSEGWDMTDKIYYTSEILTIETNEDIKTDDSIHLQLNSDKDTKPFDVSKEYTFTYSL